MNEKQKLIDSILNDYPIPLVLLADRPGSKSTSFEILDGLQRLHSIVSFIENGFLTPDGKRFDVDEFTRAKEELSNGKFNIKADMPKLARTEVAKILDYILPVSIIRNASEATITDVFSRINSYGHRLSDQERRQAGLLSDFSQFIREMACEIRGDVSIETLPLFQMPEISVDLPKSKYGYSVQAEEVFWVKHGILRSTDLRDSLDEQLIADITACIVSGRLIERSKDTLDKIYDSGSADGTSISSSFSTYGSKRIRSETKYCLEIIDKIVKACNSRSLRRLIFETQTTNPFPTVFSSIFLAIHEISFGDRLLLADPIRAHRSLTNIHGRLNTGRDALSPDERRNNINTIKGLLRDSFVAGDVNNIVQGTRRELDIENTIRRSQIETPSFELKQGILRLDTARTQDSGILEKIMQTLCAIANNGPTSRGTVIIGIADKEEDAQMIKRLDSIEPLAIGNRYIVGIGSEANIMKIKMERYYQIWRDKISNSKLSNGIKADIMSNLEICDFKGFHLIVASIPPQRSVSFYDGKVYIRNGDRTAEANPEQIISVGTRFQI